MTKPTKTSYDAPQSLRRRATPQYGPRYPKIYPSQVVVRRRNAWYDRGFKDISVTDRNPDPGDSPNLFDRLQGSFRCKQT